MRKALSIFVVLAVLSLCGTNNVDTVSTLGSRAGGLDFLTGTACGSAVGAIIVLAAVGAGAVTGGVGFVIGTGALGILSGLACN